MSRQPGGSKAGKRRVNSGQKEQQAFYLKLRERIQKWLHGKGASHRWAELIMLAPDFFYLLMRLVADPQVPGAYKSELLFVIAYFISPIDLLPEGLIGPAGYLDDILLTAYVLDRMLNKVDRSLVERYWPGEGDLLTTIQGVMAVAGRVVPVGRIRRWARKRFDRQ